MEFCASDGESFEYVAATVTAFNAMELAGADA
jgi:hypothetical protein